MTTHEQYMAMNLSDAAKKLTEAQISKLRREASEHGDSDMAAICDLALDGSIDVDDYTTLTTSGERKLRTMTQEQAYEACAKAISDARAQS